MWHIDMYQGKDAGNIDNNQRANQLTTTTEAVINYVLYSNIANDRCGVRKIFLDNRYACPYLFPILF